MFKMHTRKRTQSVLAILSQDPCRRLLLKYSTIMLAFALLHYCEAQCSIPSASFTASTNSQLLYSPNYPDFYPEDTLCSWLITSPITTGRIQLRVVHDNFSCCCNNDHLLIKDGSDSAARSIAILCSELNPVTITSSGPVIYGEFRSDGDGQTGLGYTLQFNYFDSNVSCPSGWMRRDGYCYKLYDEVLPWQQAASRCGYDGGFLISIVDEQENNFLVDSFRNQTSSAWIGLDSAGNWLDGSSSLLYNNFRNESASTTDCSIIDMGENGLWRDTDCVNQQLNFICKKTMGGAGERYWTEVAISIDEENSSVNVFSVVVGVIVVFVFISSCFRARGNNNASNNGSCFVQLVTCICKGISECVAAIGRAVEFCLSCRCLGCAGQSEEAATNRTPSNNPVTHQQEISLEEGQTSRRNSAGSASPPAYGDVISEPPPPSYSEALDPTYNYGPTDARGSSISLNIASAEAIAAPANDRIVAL